LISLINMIQRSGPPEMVNNQLTNLLKEWGVTCSITGKLISIIDLRYWNMKRDEIYYDAEVMLTRHQEVVELKTNR